MWTLHLVAVFSGFSGTPGFLPCIHISLTGVSKLVIGVNVSLNSCLFLFLSPGMDWLPMSIAEIDSRLPERA